MFVLHFSDRLRSATRLAVLGVMAGGVAGLWACAADPGGRAAADPASPADTVGPDGDAALSDPTDPGPALETVGDPEAGDLLYHAVARGCYVCHGEFAAGTALAPGIAAATTSEIRGALLADALHSGGPQLDFTAQDVADLAAYLENPDPTLPDMNTNGPDSGTNGLS
jgi:hypothetical protein